MELRISRFDVFDELNALFKNADVDGTYDDKKFEKQSWSKRSIFGGSSNES